MIDFIIPWERLIKFLLQFCWRPAGPADFVVVYRHDLQNAVNMGVGRFGRPAFDKLAYIVPTESKIIDHLCDNILGAVLKGGGGG